MKTSRRDLGVLVLASALLLLYAVQAHWNLEWSLLARAQADDRYKLASGGVLAAYLYFQWSPRRRIDPARHRLAGAFAPVVLYAHATRSGYGYLTILCAVYLGTALAGTLHHPVLLARRRWLFTAWFITHVALATVLVLLAGYHVVIALAYE